jgi:hypothetical protein
MSIILNGSTGITTPADSITGNATVGGTLTVTGATTLTGGATIGGVAAVAVAPGASGNVIFSTDGSTWSPTQKIVQGTAVDTTSGTSINFTSIPSWVKRITVIFSGVSTSGSSNLIIQIGTSGGVVNTGYYGTAALVGAATANSTMTSGFLLTPSQGSSTATQGIATLCFQRASSNTWASNGSIGSSDAGNIALSAGVKDLPGTLDRVRITTVNGTDTFDAGVINLLWE